VYSYDECLCIYNFDLAEQVCWDGSAETRTALVNSPAYDVSGTVMIAWSSSVPAVATVATAGPAAAAATETITIVQNCVQQFCKQFTVVETADNINAAWTPIGPFCSDDAAVPLAATGTAAGEFTGEGVVETATTGDVNTYTFDPTMVTIAPGEAYEDINVCYTADNSTGCTVVECHNIRVYAPVVATINDLAFDCTIAPNGNIGLGALFDGSNTTPGGVFTLMNTSGTGVSGAIVGHTLQYNGPGCYEIKYEVEAFAGADGTCKNDDTAFIIIPEKPQPSFDLPEELCWDGIGALVVTELLNSPIYDDGTPTYEWSLANANGISVTLDAAATSSAANPVILVTDVTDASGIGSIEICLTETFTYGAMSCGTVLWSSMYR